MLDMMHKIIHTIRQNRIFQHSLFWLSTLVIYPIYAMGFGQYWVASFLTKLFILPTQILATYHLIYGLLPKYLLQKKYLRFFVLFLVSISFFCTLAHLVEDYVNPLYLTGYNDIHSISDILTNPFANIGYQGTNVYLTVLIVSIIKIIKDRFEEKQQLTVLQKEKTEAELNLLKAQINPRILTKSLRQLQKLSQQQSDKAPEVVLKLSEMLDYMLYQCNDPKVDLHKELSLIQNYLDMEQIRYGDQLSIEFSQAVHSKEIAISPLLLLSIVETAFQKEPPLNRKEQIVLEVKEHHQQLTCLLKSTLINNWNISNLRQQLDLLYKDQYSLTTDSDSIQLSIDLR